MHGFKGNGEKKDIFRTYFIFTLTYLILYETTLYKIELRFSYIVE